MLVFTRRKGERIFIGDGVVVTLIAAGRDKVRIGIEAPAEVAVDREEVRTRRIESTTLPETCAEGRNVQ